MTDTEYGFNPGLLAYLHRSMSICELILGILLFGEASGVSTYLVSRFFGGLLGQVIGVRAFDWQL